jgi:hypothetical protein
MEFALYLNFVLEEDRRTRTIMIPAGANSAASRGIVPTFRIVNACSAFVPPCSQVQDMLTPGAVMIV